MEKRANALSLQNFNKVCTRYENFLLNFDNDFEEHQEMFQDVSKTWFNVQSEHERYMLTVSDDTYESEILWIDEPETKFHESRSRKCQLEKALKKQALTLEKTKSEENAKMVAGKEDALKRNELRERCRKLNDRYTIELNRLSNICQSFEDISAPNDKTLKEFKSDFQKQLKEVTDLFEALSEIRDSSEEELNVTAFTNNAIKFDVIFYQASNSLPCQSECGGGDAVDTKRKLTHMEK